MVSLSDRSWEPTLASGLLVSLATGTIATVLTHPFELSKTKIQIHNEGVGMHQRGLANGYSMFKMYQNFFIRGYGPGVIYTGLSVALQARLSYLAVRNSIYKVLYDHFKPVKKTNDLTHREKGVIAAFAGAIGTIVSNKYECAFVRRVGDLGRESQFVRENIFKNPLAGLHFHILRSVIFNGFSIYIYDQAKERYWNTFGDTSLGKPWGCFCVAFFAWIFILPVDSLKTRIQYRYPNTALNRLPYKSLSNYLHRTIVNEGLNTFYAGSVPFFLRTFLYSISTIWLCDVWTKSKFKNY